jgi:ORF6N domain
MSNDITILDHHQIQSKIYTIRGLQVMLDGDLAKLYAIESKRLNEQVKRNSNRFPEKFKFQLTEKEFQNLRSQFATLETGHGKHRKYLPYAFTEQGVSMLSAVLKSDTAVKVSIQIMDAFVNMRKFINNNAQIFQRLTNIEQKQISTELRNINKHLEIDTKLDQIFDAIESREVKPKQGIFFDGQIFDAYLFVADLIKSAKTSIVLIDNYVDETVLTLLTKRQKLCNATIYTKNLSKNLQLDLKKHNEQYPPIIIKKF